MDNDDYESLNEDFKVVDGQLRRSHFFTSQEMINDITIPKENIDHDEMIGDPSRGKSIKTSRPAVYDIHTATSMNTAPRNLHKRGKIPGRQETNYRVCPICSEPMVATCNCNNHDSVCENSHKWHVKDGKIMLGHTH